MKRRVQSLPNHTRGDSVDKTDDGRAHLTKRFTASLSYKLQHYFFLRLDERNANRPERYALLTIEAKSDNDDGTRARGREQDSIQEGEGKERER